MSPLLATAIVFSSPDLLMLDGYCLQGRCGLSSSGPSYSFLLVDKHRRLDIHRKQTFLSYAMDIAYTILYYACELEGTHMILMHFLA